MNLFEHPFSNKFRLFKPLGFRHLPKRLCFVTSQLKSNCGLTVEDDFVDFLHLIFKISQVVVPLSVVPTPAGRADPTSSIAYSIDVVPDRVQNQELDYHRLLGRK